MSQQIKLLDTAYYSPYPYGWDYDNYSLSGDDRTLGYGKILFNPTNFAGQIGQFSEQILALNRDGKVAFGQSTIWDTTTFPSHGDATRIADMPLSTTIVKFDFHANVLYAVNPANNTLCTIEQVTTHGIPFSWLNFYGLPTTDDVEMQDPDNDGYTTLQEWLLDTNPTNRTPVLTLEWAADASLNVPTTSPIRTYELQQTTNLTAATWQVAAQRRGTGTNLLFDVSAIESKSPAAFFRVTPKL